jgi:hypothetical protein
VGYNPVAYAGTGLADSAGQPNRYPTLKKSFASFGLFILEISPDCY